MQELNRLGCHETPIIELWNKIDLISGTQAEEIQIEAMMRPVDVEALVNDTEEPPKSLLEEAASISPTDDSALESDLENEGEDNLQIDENEEESSEQSDDDPVFEEAETDKEEDTFQDLESYLLASNAAAQDDATESVAKPLKSSETAQSPTSNEKKTRKVQRKHFTVAASAKTGLGMDIFLETLHTALSLFLVPVKLMIPYNKDDGIIALIHQQGIVDRMEYLEQGTQLECKVPQQLIDAKLFKFRI